MYNLKFIHSKTTNMYKFELKQYFQPIIFSFKWYYSKALNIMSSYQFVILDYETIFLPDYSYLGKLPTNKKITY